jgi:mannose-1-phosphate guanylyltransferase
LPPDLVTESFNVPVRYLREETECGTAGGLYRYRDVVLQGSPDAVFVLHCDIGCSFPLKGLLAFHLESKGDCTVLGTEVTDTEAHNYGAMVVNEKSSELVHYAEKPVTDISAVVNAGVYVFSPALFEHLGKVGDEVNRGSTYRPYFSAKEAQNIYIEQDILMSLAGRGRVFVYETRDFWCQIKDPAGALRCSGEYLEHFRTERPEVLAKASVGMRAKVGRTGSSGSFAGTVGVGSNKLTIVDPVFIDASATVHPTATVGPNAVIGAGVTIGPGARLKDCIILEDCAVSDHAVVVGSIVGWGSSIGHWARVQGTLAKPSILGAGVTVEPEIIVAGCTVLPHKGLSESSHNRIIL